MKNVLILFLTLVTASAAANGINGELLVKVGTTGNKSIPSSQTTNVTISVTSRVVDGGAAAFSLNSSNLLTSGNLLEVKNMGTNSAVISPFGGYGLGNALDDDWGGLSSGDAFIADTFGVPSLTHLLSSTTSANYEAGSVITSKTETNGIASVIISGFTGSETGAWTFNGGSTGIPIGILKFDYESGSDILFKAEPTASAGVTPYLLDTYYAHTSGNLAEFKNNGTNYFNVNADQASTNTPMTININGTLQRVHVGAPDSGGTGLRALTVVN